MKKNKSCSDDIATEQSLNIKYTTLKKIACEKMEVWRFAKKVYRITNLQFKRD